MSALKKRVKEQVEKKREKIFLQVIDILNTYNDKEKRKIADDAEVHWVTLYNWCSFKTFNPHINTLVKVVIALDYEIVLVPRSKTRKLKLAK